MSAFGDKQTVNHPVTNLPKVGSLVLRITVMAAGVPDRLWTIEEMARASSEVGLQCL
jgi:hypothetical protein